MLNNHKAELKQRAGAVKCKWISMQILYHENKVFQTSKKVILKITRVKSGQGYKNVSNILIIRSIIKKGKRYGTAINLSRAGCPQTQCMCERNTWVRRWGRPEDCGYADGRHCAVLCLGASSVAALRLLEKKKKKLMTSGLLFARSCGHTIPPIKHGGGSIMRWGCSSAGGTKRVVRTEGKNKHAKLSRPQSNGDFVTGLLLTHELHAAWQSFSSCGKIDPCQEADTDISTYTEGHRCQRCQCIFLALSVSKV